MIEGLIRDQPKLQFHIRMMLNVQQMDEAQKYSRLRCLLFVKGLLISFYLDWSGSILQIRTNIIKVGSKSWLLTCSSNITLSLPSYTGSALKRGLNFCNGYLSLLYFCTDSSWDKFRFQKTRHKSCALSHPALSTQFSWVGCYFVVA